MDQEETHLIFGVDSNQGENVQIIFRFCRMSRFQLKRARVLVEKKKQTVNEERERH